MKRDPDDEAYFALQELVYILEKEKAQLRKALASLVEAYGGNDPARDAPIIKRARALLKKA